MAPVTVWTDQGLRTTITTRDQIWHADEPVESGGTNSAATPMEQMLGALGSCIVVTLHLVANRKNWPLEKVEVRLDVERFSGGEYPAYQGASQFVHEIREKVILHGPNLTADQRSMLMDIATRCPVRRLLEHPTFFVEADAAPSIPS
ncbi:MAG TPA: OsmC family protein [Phototrophicaceae bacterium]|nr:OsmC family protein [Phototrophicaceae bacterium]